MTGRAETTEAFRQLAVALRAGDDAVAWSLAERLGIPTVLLTQWELGPRGGVDVDAVALALSCVAVLADGAAPAGAWLSDPEVIGMVADAVELTAADGDGHPWLRGISAVESSDCPGARELLLARAAEGNGRSDEARLLIGSCLTAAPGLVPAVRDAMEYELCAGNWERAFELASSLGDDDAVAGPLLRPLARLREPARGAERGTRNQPCPCGSGRKYKACCRAKDLEGGTHPLPDRAPALYAMLATYAQRARGHQIADRISVCGIGAPHAAMLALDLAMFDGGIAGRFLVGRGHMLRPDERDLLEDWLGRPVDMYEVTRVSRGSELTLRSVVGGPSRIRQRDRMFSLSVRPLDIVIGRLLPDGDRLPDGGKYLRALGGMAILDRGRRGDALALFADGPVVPATDPAFPVLLVSQFVPQARPVFQTADGDEYRFCETTIDVDRARDVWHRMTSPCLPAPEPPIRDLAGYDAYVARLPSRFWVRNSDAEVEYVGQVDANRLTNLGTIERTRRGFKVTANSVRRAADLTAMVLEAAVTAGQVTSQSAMTAAEMLSDRDGADDDGPASREAMCRRLGLDAALTAVPSRELVLEEHFLPMEPSAEAEVVVREINRELGIRSMLAARSYEGRTAAEAVAAGGTARDQVLVMIDDCEWRLDRADSGDADLLPRPDDLRRRVGLR